MVQVLNTVEVVKVQEHNLSGMGRQEGADLLQTFSHLKAQQTPHKGANMVSDQYPLNTVQSFS